MGETFAQSRRRMMTSTKGDPMTRIAVLTLLVRRISGRGALDNVVDVLNARAAVMAEVESFEARVARAA